jgi:hypothetical protein
MALWHYGIMALWHYGIMALCTFPGCVFVVTLVASILMNQSKYICRYVLTKVELYFSPPDVFPIILQRPPSCFTVMG